MISLSRVLIGLALGLLLAIPVVGDDALGGGGETGVWILPSSRPVNSIQVNGAQFTQRAVRSFRVVSTPSDLRIQMPADMGAPLVVLHELSTGLPVEALVSGNTVTLTQRGMRLLVNQASSGRALGQIADANGRGFLVTIDRTDSGLLVRAY